MKKIRKEERKITQNVHEFFCDGCGEKLGEEVEYEDGYVASIGEFLTSIYFEDTWYRMKKNFCIKCRAEQIEKIKNALMALGYEEE